MAARTEIDVENDVKAALIALPPHPVIMPECADFLLSQINPFDLPNEITQLFNEYFVRTPHKIFSVIPSQNLSNPEKDLVLKALKCTERDPDIILQKKSSNKQAQETSSHELDDLTEFGCCLPCSCITLEGNRRLKKMTGVPSPPPGPPPGIKKLLQPDVIWLFYFERLGLFKILGAILDDFVYYGNHPIPTDDVTALILEMMTRHFKTGNSSTSRERASTYRRVLGWQNMQHANLDLDKILVNSAFTRLFHRFIVLALAFYADRRLADAIKGTVIQPPSVATIIAIQDTISLLKNSMEAFIYGRNYYHTLNSIVWVIATIDLVRRLKDDIGIPSGFVRLDQIIPAAYNILIDKKPINTTDPNRYKLHFECAQDARDVLIDIAGNAFNPDNTSDLKLWLNLIEDRIEGYRAAYLELTGIDLAKPEFRTEGTLKVEQQI
jgi:hypothetical protein